MTRASLRALYALPIVISLSCSYAQTIAATPAPNVESRPDAAASDLRTLPAVEVQDRRTISTATRTEIDPLRLPFAATLVDRAQMDAAGAVTLEDELRSVPGLQFGTQGNYYSRFETRGLRDTQDVLVLIDGVPLRMLQGNADVTLIAPDLVDRVEFIKGPASALYGRNAIGGVAQFFLKPEQAGGSASATVGRFGRTDASVRQRWDFARGNVFLGLSGNHWDGFQRDVGRNQQASIVAADMALTQAWTTGFQWYASEVNADRGSVVPLANGRPMFGIGWRDNYAIDGAKVSGDYASVSWKNTMEWGQGWRLRHLTSFARYDRFDTGGITIVPPPAAVSKGYRESRTNDKGIFHDLTLARLSAGRDWSNEWQLGLHAERGWQDQASPNFSNAATYRGPDYDTPVTAPVPDPHGIRGPLVASRFDQDVHGAYLQNRIDWRHLGLTAGLRHDRFTQTLVRSDTAVRSHQRASRTSPRVGADWLWLDDTRAQHVVFANWSEGFRPQPVVLDTRAGVVVPNILRPERTRSKEIGLKGRDRNGAWSYQSSVFLADKVDGQRSYRNGPDSFISTNATSRVKGVENQVQWHVGSRWRGYAHYTWQDARLRDFQTYTNAGVPSANYGGLRMRMSARHIAGLGVTWQRGDWTLSTSARYVGSRYLRDNTFASQKLPPYMLVDAAATWRADNRWSVLAGVSNLTDRVYINDDFSSQDAGNVGAPRTWFVRARYQF